MDYQRQGAALAQPKMGRAKTETERRWDNR